MNRRTLPVASAFVAIAALLLTACGGEDQPKANDKIAGAEEGESGKKSPSPTADGADKIDRPEMKLPSDFKLTFDWSKPSDPDEAAALGDMQNYLTALNYGITEQDPESAAYKFYVVPLESAHEYAKDQIQQYVDGGWVLGGNLRYTAAKPTVDEKGGRVAISFCEDASKAYGKEVKTGKAIRTKKSDKDFTAYTIVMNESKSVKGLWQARDIEAEMGAAECIGK